MTSPRSNQKYLTSPPHSPHPTYKTLVYHVEKGKESADDCLKSYESKVRGRLKEIQKWLSLSDEETARFINISFRVGRDIVRMLSEKDSSSSGEGLEITKGKFASYIQRYMT